MIQPLHDTVLMKLEPKDEFKHGIILLEKDAPEQAEVLFVGLGVRDVKVGDVVMFNKYSTSNITIDKVEYLSIPESDIWCVVEK